MTNESEIQLSKSGSGVLLKEFAPKGGSVGGELSIGSEEFCSVVLIAITVVAVWLRWYGLSSQSLWLDEGYTYWISRFSPRDICKVLVMDTGVPFYYILMHYWSNWFGTSEFWLRALSTVLATLSIPLYYFLARKILTEKLAIVFAMAGFAANCLQVWYAKEARCHALLLFLTLGGVYCLLLYLENCKILSLCGVAAFLAAGLYTHNIAFLYFPGFVLLWLIYPSERKLLERLRDGLFVCVAIGILYLPWLQTFRAQLQRQGLHGNFWLEKPHIRDLFDSLFILSGFDTATLQSAFRSLFHATRLFGFWTWAPGVLTMIVICLLGGLYGASELNRRKSLGLAAYSLSPMLLAFAYSRISGPIYTTRLFLGPCAFLPMLLAAPIAFQAGTRKRWFAMFGGLSLLATVISTVGYVRREQKEDWRGVAQYLQSLPEKQRLIVVLPDIAQPLMHYYASGFSSSSSPVDMTGLLTRYIPPDVDLERRTLALSDDQNTDALALLSRATTSGKYAEIDFVVQPGGAATLVSPMLDFVNTNCSSIETMEFHWLRVMRCKQ